MTIALRNPNFPAAGNKVVEGSKWPSKGRMGKYEFLFSFLSSCGEKKMCGPHQDFSLHFLSLPFSPCNLKIFLSSIAFSLFPFVSPLFSQHRLRVKIPTKLILNFRNPNYSNSGASTHTFLKTQMAQQSNFLGLIVLSPNSVLQFKKP